MEKLEHAAKTLFITRLLGGENELPPERVKELLAVAKSAYGLEIDERNIF